MFLPGQRKPTRAALSRAERDRGSITADLISLYKSAPMT